MTAAFREARDLAGINVEPGRRPHTYHKLRGLRTRLHMQQGDNPQALASRKDAATTAVYADSRGAFEPLRRGGKDGIDEIAIALGERPGGPWPVQELLECRLKGVKVTELPTFFEREYRKVPL